MVKNLPAVWDTRVWSLGGEDPLEKELATHSRILAWRILWTEEPGRLQSTGSKESGMTEWLTHTHTHTHTHFSPPPVERQYCEHCGFLISMSNLKKFPLKMHSFAWVLIHCNSLNFQRDYNPLPSYNETWQLPSPAHTGCIGSDLRAEHLYHTGVTF